MRLDRVLLEEVPLVDKNNMVDVKRLDKKVKTYFPHIDIEKIELNGKKTYVGEKEINGREKVPTYSEQLFKCNKHDESEWKKVSTILKHPEKKICPKDTSKALQQSEAERIANNKIINLIKRRGYKDSIWTRWFDPKKYKTSIPYVNNEKGNLDLDLFVEFPHDDDGHTGIFIDGQEKDGFGFAIDGVTHYKGTACYVSKYRTPKENELHPYKQHLLNDIVRQYSVGGKKFRLYNYKLIQNKEDGTVNSKPEDVEKWVSDCWNDIKNILNKTEGYKPRDVQREFSNDRIKTFLDMFRSDRYKDKVIELRNGKKIRLGNLANVLEKNPDKFNIGQWLKIYFNFEKSKNVSNEELEHLIDVAISKSKFQKQMTTFLAQSQNKYKNNPAK